MANYVGDSIWMVAAFADGNGDPVATTGIELRIYDDRGRLLETIAAADIANPSTGSYRYAYVLPDLEEIRYVFEGTVAGEAVLSVGTVTITAAASQQASSSLALVETVGSASANTYATLAEAEAYFASRLNTDGRLDAWTDAVEENKKRALVQAARRLDQERFQGSPVNPLNGTSTSTTQALQWPRYNTCDANGWSYEGTMIPPCVKDAQCEIALDFLNADADPFANSGLESFEEMTVGPIKLRPRESFPAGGLADHVRRLLRPVLVGGAGSVRLVRG